MASSSSDNINKPVHDFIKFGTDISRIRTLYGPPSMGVEYNGHYGVEDDNEDKPLSYLIFFDELRNIEDEIGRKSEVEVNIYKSIIEICKTLPGFPGGGRSFIEIPLNVTLCELPEVISQIRDIIDKFRDNFKYSQKFKYFNQFIDQTDHTTKIIKNIDFLTCLPENGGSPQIEIGFKHNMKNVILIIVVDSYWQPAIDMLIKTIEICITHTSYVNSNSKRGVDVNNVEEYKDIYEEFKKNILFLHQEKTMYTQVGKTTCFNIPDFSYCELMGYIHRNAILTRLCHMISKIQTKNGVKLIDTFGGLLTKSFELPSITPKNAKILGKEWLYLGEMPVKLQLIDHQYIRNAIHSTIHFVAEPANDGSQIYSLWFSKRIFERQDFLTGDVFVFYGDHEGGFYVNHSKTSQDFKLMIGADKIKFIAKKVSKSYQLFKWFDENYLYTSRYITAVSPCEWTFSSDILRCDWRQYTSKDKTISTQRLYGISFDSHSGIDMINLQDDSKEIIPFQLYNDDIGFKMCHKPMINDFLIEAAINEHLESNYRFSRLNLSIMPIILTIKTIKSIDKMSVSELVNIQINFHEEQDRTKNERLPTKRQIIYCKNHNLSDIEKYFKKTFNGKYIFYKSYEDKKYGDESSYSVSTSSVHECEFTRIYHYCEYEKIK